jgi:hypothetical protein
MDADTAEVRPIVGHLLYFSGLAMSISMGLAPRLYQTIAGKVNQN